MKVKNLNENSPNSERGDTQEGTERLTHWQCGGTALIDYGEGT